MQSPESPVHHQHFGSGKSQNSATFSQWRQRQLLHPLPLQPQVWEPAQRGVLLGPAGEEHAPGCCFHARRDGGDPVQTEHQLHVTAASAGPQAGAHPDDGEQAGAQADTVLPAHHRWDGRNQQNWQVRTDPVPGVVWGIQHGLLGGLLIKGHSGGYRWLDFALETRVKVVSFTKWKAYKDYTRGNCCSRQTDKQNVLARLFHILENRLWIHLYFSSEGPRAWGQANHIRNIWLHTTESTCTLDYAPVLFIWHHATCDCKGLHWTQLPHDPFGLQSR